MKSMGGWRCVLRNWHAGQRAGSGDSAIAAGKHAAASRLAPRFHEALAGLIIVHPGSMGEMEILVAYGPTCFASKAGQLAGNHFLTIREGLDRLAKTGRAVLWEGAKPITFRAG